ncbi:MAG: hypothetical protein A2201_14000 [Alicyclobacillus sp. RIFOXYA1_FULL_53_8]|nr:MAG: hypothetical protein A2201_14000 [Alicyclobacillus sp. RIFOXYA1_FULL_53_8]
MTTKANLEMQFLTDQNKKVRVTVQNPKLPIDNAAVDSAMDLIVSKNVFAFAQGHIVSKVGAVEIQTDTTDIP